MKGARFANYRRSVLNEVWVRVMCPQCGGCGAHPLTMAQPICHVCVDRVLMLPASNHECVCTWQQAVEYGNAVHASAT